MTPRALFHPARLARRPVLSTQSDERLVDLVRAGSESAFETIVERYRRALMRYVSRLLPPERAEDVVQQAFVKAYEAMHRDGAELNLQALAVPDRAQHGAERAARPRRCATTSWTSASTASSGPTRRSSAARACATCSVAVQALPGAPARRDPAARARGPQLRGDRARPRRDRRRRAPASQPGAQLAARGGRGAHADAAAHPARLGRLGRAGRGARGRDGRRGRRRAAARSWPRCARPRS